MNPVLYLRKYKRRMIFTRLLIIEDNVIEKTIIYLKAYKNKVV